MRDTMWTLWTLAVLATLTLAASPPGSVGVTASNIGGNSWSEAYDKAVTFVGGLTLLEKVNVTTGTGWTLGPCVGNTGSVPRRGYRGLCLQDSPLGVRGSDYTTAFPAGVNAAATWDRGLIRLRGRAMGEEHRGKGSNVQLGPVAGPLGSFAEGGRNWEGFSPDPYLTGHAMIESIIGIQAAGVIACAKHFIGNEQEHFRQRAESNGYRTHANVTEALSANIGDRQMHELYLWPFADAVRAGVASVMCAYQQVNNTYSAQNAKLLNGLLKDELGFRGFVVSDWGAVRSGVATVLAGMDMLMPGDGNDFSDGASWFGKNLTIAVLNGTLPESRLNDMAVRIIAAWYKLAQDTDYPVPNFNAFTLATAGNLYNPDTNRSSGFGILNQHVDVRGRHADVALAVARDSIVLLKNAGNALPLGHRDRSLVLVGSDAAPAMYGPNGCSDRGCDNGTLAMGWGSGTANFPYLVTPLDAITSRGSREGALVQHVIDDFAYKQINATVSQANVTALVFVNSDSGEGYLSIDGNEGDRNNLTAWHAGDKLVQTVAALCANTIVVVHSVGPMIVEPWIDHPNVTAVLWAGLPGQESGNSLVSLLYGDVNPNGKLPYTIARNPADYGTRLMYEPNGPVPQQDFDWGLEIDYRHFDARGIEPRYAFGFGRSYTTFSLGPTRITRISNTPYAPRSSYPPDKPAVDAIPASNTSPNDALFPPDIDRVYLFQYPYIDSVSQVKQGNDPYPYEVNSSPTTHPPSPAGGGPGGNPSLYDVRYRIEVDVTNTGGVAGAEVVQLYLSFPTSSEFPTPPQQLRGFQKVSLQPNETRTVMMDLLRKDMMVWNTVIQNWQTLPGDYQVRVGTSSRDNRIVGTITARLP